MNKRSQLARVEAEPANFSSHHKAISSHLLLTCYGGGKEKGLDNDPMRTGSIIIAFTIISSWTKDFTVSTVMKKSATPCIINTKDGTILTPGKRMTDFRS